LRRRTLDDKKVGVREPVQRPLQHRFVGFRNVTQKRIAEIASEHRPDLRDFARRAEPVQARGERLLQGRRDCLNAALLAALEQQSRHLLDEQRHAAGPLADAVDQLL
jgi:hypothetical protein